MGSGQGSTERGLVRRAGSPANSPRCRQGSSSPGQQRELDPERLGKGHSRYVLFQMLLCAAWKD